MRAAADEALRTVVWPTKAGQDYLTLSGGEKQLCILARTIAEDAPLLCWTGRTVRLTLRTAAG